MIRSARTLASAAATALVLAACSGGGGTAQAPAVPAPTAAPTAGPASRAQASITVHYTPSVHRLHTSSSKRSPRFVDPNGTQLQISSFTTPSFVSLDALTFRVAPGPDGSQTVTAPITSSGDPGSLTYVKVVETDPDAGVLASGQGTLSGVMPGTLVTGPAITLYMRATGIIATTNVQTGGDAMLISYDPAAPTELFNSQSSSLNACSALGSGGFALLPIDALFDYSSLFGRQVGAGGIPPIQVPDQKADNGGTSRLATDSSGFFHVTFDASNNGVTAHLVVYDINPAVSPGTILTQGYVHLTNSCT